VPFEPESVTVMPLMSSGGCAPARREPYPAI
jgi:hypothetical protein